MKNLAKLMKGEINRLNKYKILPIGALVSLIWVLIIGLSNKETAQELAPMLIMMDATMMSIILLGASHFYEKQEGTLKSLLTTPVSLFEIFLSKVLSSLLVTYISAIIVVSASLIIHQISISILLLVLYIAIIGVAHVALGYLLTLFSKDFGGLIGLYAVYAFLSFMPSLLFSMEILPESTKWYLMLSPTHASQILLNNCFTAEPIEFVLVAALYLLLIAGCLFQFVVYKKFKNCLVEG